MSDMARTRGITGRSAAPPPPLGAVGSGCALLLLAGAPLRRLGLGRGVSRLLRPSAWAALLRGGDVLLLVRLPRRRGRVLCRNCYPPANNPPNGPPPAASRCLPLRPRPSGLRRESCQGTAPRSRPHCGAAPTRCSPGQRLADICVSGRTLQDSLPTAGQTSMISTTGIKQHLKRARSSLRQEAAAPLDVSAQRLVPIPIYNGLACRTTMRLSVAERTWSTPKNGGCATRFETPHVFTRTLLRAMSAHVSRSGIARETAGRGCPDAHRCPSICSLAIARTKSNCAQYTLSLDGAAARSSAVCWPS